MQVNGKGLKTFDRVFIPTWGHASPDLGCADIQSGRMKIELFEGVEINDLLFLGWFSFTPDRNLCVQAR